jgi:hypothetical protein
MSSLFAGRPDVPKILGISIGSWFSSRSTTTNLVFCDLSFSRIGGRTRTIGFDSSGPRKSGFCN